MTEPSIPSADSHLPLMQSPQRQFRNARSRLGLQLPWLMVIASILATSIFAILYAEGRTALFVGSCWVLGCLCMAFVTLHRPQDNLVASKIATLLYAACFSYAPLWLADIRGYRSPYYGSDSETLMGVTAFIALAGYAGFLIGYFPGLRLRRNSRYTSSSKSFSATPSQRRSMLLWMAALGATGTLCYLRLLMGVGGLSQLLSGYTQARADMFSGVYGGWFWGMHLLFAAYGLLAILLIQKHPWFCLVAAVMLAVAFVPFQGRDIIVAPLFCWLIFFHVLRKPVRWRLILLAGVGLLLLSALVGVFRSTDDRFGSNHELNFVSAFTENIGRHLTRLISQNIEQLDSAMIAVRYVETEHQTLGPMALMSWAEPIDRALLGNSIPSIYTGAFMDLLIIPEHRGWNTALSPSLPGELYIALGYWGILLGMPAYGLLFSRLTLWHDNRNRWPMLFAAYPFVVYMLAKMVVDGSTHFFRPLLIFSVVILCAYLSPSHGKNRVRKKKAS